MGGAGGGGGDGAGQFNVSGGGGGGGSGGQGADGPSDGGDGGVGGNGGRGGDTSAGGAGGAGGLSGRGGTSGAAFGAGVFNATGATLALAGTTLDHNIATGGPSRPGGPGGTGGPGGNGGTGGGLSPVGWIGSGFPGSAGSGGAGTCPKPPPGPSHDGGPAGSGGSSGNAGDGGPGGAGAPGGSGNPGGIAEGGGLYNAGDATLSGTVHLTNDRANGGPGGPASTGGSGGAGGVGGAAGGGALPTGAVSAPGGAGGGACNGGTQGVNGAGGAGGNGGSGGNVGAAGSGGRGGDGGTARGGAVYNAAALRLTGNEFDSDGATGGAGGAAGDGGRGSAAGGAAGYGANGGAGDPINGLPGGNGGSGANGGDGGNGGANGGGGSGGDAVGGGLYTAVPLTTDSANTYTSDDVTAGAGAGVSRPGAGGGSGGRAGAPGIGGPGLPVGRTGKPGDPGAVGGPGASDASPGQPGTAQFPDFNAVVLPPVAPRFTANNPPLTTTVGTLYAYTFAASGNPAPTFTLMTGAPTWLSLDPQTGRLAGVPPTGTTMFVFSVVASNGVTPDAVTASYRISVLAPPAAPAITSPGSATFTSGRGGTFTVTTTGNPTATITETGMLPSGVAFVDNHDGTATLTASPSAAAGVAHLVIQAANGVTPSATQSFTLAVSAAAAGPAIDARASTHGLNVARVRLSAHAAGELLVAFVAAKGPARGKQTAVITGRALSWKLAARADRSRGDAEVWTAIAPALLSRTAITARLARRGYSEALTVIAFRPAARGGAARTSSAPAGRPSVTVTTSSAISKVFAVGDDSASSTPRTPAPHQVLLEQVLSRQRSTYWLQTTQATVAAGTSVTILDTKPRSDPFNVAAIEIRGS